MLYLITDGRLVKLGKSKNPQKRLKQLQTGCGVRLHLLDTFNLPDVYERRLHGILRDCKTKGEWFDMGDDNGLNWLREYIRELETDFLQKS